VIRWARLPHDASVADELRTARVTATREALEALPRLARNHDVSADVGERLTQETNLA
jgi:CPA1 family monovalent cation:H+ antiporter